jgi:hypothetical protein
MFWQKKNCKQTLPPVNCEQLAAQAASLSALVGQMQQQMAAIHSRLDRIEAHENAVMSTAAELSKILKFEK